MKPALILYATREGHAAHIADHIAGLLRAAGEPTEVFDVAKFTTFDLANHSKVILIASVHSGKHEPEMVKLATRYRQELDQLPSAFLSVSMTEATAENASAPPGQRAEATRLVNAMMEDFFQETGWHPGHVKAVAGGLPYSKLNFVVRFVVKQIVKHSGGDTDTSRDYDYTNWPELDRFIGDLQAHAAS
jgi:menaquinone-dependent protoporphyrinogen oxidase